MDYATYKALMAALEAGTATPDQQREAFAYIQRMKGQHAKDLREADRDARDAYGAGQADAAAEARGEPRGCW